MTPRQHLTALKKRHKLVYKYVRAGYEESTYATREVSICDSNSVGSYLTALHEVAHIIHRPARYPEKEWGARYWKGVLKAEEAAWVWAIKKSVVPVPHWMFQRIATCLTQYKGMTGIVYE